MKVHREDLLRNWAIDMKYLDYFLEIMAETISARFIRATKYACTNEIDDTSLTKRGEAFILNDATPRAQ